MLVNRNHFRTLLCAFLALVQATSALAGTVRFSGALNGRESLNFYGRANVKGLVPKGTEGEVLDRKKLPSGNYGIKIKVTSLGGPSDNIKSGDEIWVYYHMDSGRRRIELFDDENQKVDEPSEGKWAQAIESFRISLPETQTEATNPKADENCVSCNDGSATLTEVKPLPGNIISELDAIVQSVTLSPELTQSSEAAQAVPELNVAKEEIISFLNSIKRKQPKTNEIIAETVLDAAAKENVPVELILGVMRIESGFDPKARSKKDAQGLMQIMFGTWKDLGGGKTNRYDPEKNIRLGVKYLAQMIARYPGDLKTALSAYNFGMGNVDEYRALGKEMPDGVRKYVKAVIGYQNEYIAYVQTTRTTLAKN